MKAIFRYYTPDEGLEDIQAEVYGKNMKNLGGTLATANQIRQRYQAEKVDPQGVRYALKEDGSPLAYIQTRLSSNPDRTFIGYPWAMPDCPPEIQEKLFSETFEYIKKRDLKPDSQWKFVMGFWHDTWRKQIAFAKKNGFTIDDKRFQYVLNARAIGKADDQAYFAKVGQKHDLKSLVELGEADPEIITAFPNKDAMTGYFKDRVLTDGHCIILFDQSNKPIAAGAILPGFSTSGNLLRFSASRPGYDNLWKTLLVEISSYCVEQGWEETPLLFSCSSERNRPRIAEELKATLQLTEIMFSQMITDS
ncbi:MAG: hypothetical protein ACE5OZ_14180 [Candidatus Heimdallarchaeota archaeon]